LGPSTIHEESCCERVGVNGFGTYFCRACGRSSCQLHVALWTAGSHCCYFCFSETDCLKEPNEVLVLRNPRFRKYKSRALIVLDGLYTAGAQRHCIELMKALAEIGYFCTVLALEGGGRWARFFATRAEALILVRRSLDWCLLSSAVGYDDFSFVTAHLAAGIDWASKNVPPGTKAFAHLHSEPSPHEDISWEWACSKLRRFDQVFVPCENTLQTYVSGYERAELPEEIATKFRVFPNGIYSRLERSPLQNRKRRPSSNQVHLAVVSRLDSDKFNIPLFCETIRTLSEIYTGLSVRVAGDGECKRELRLSVEAAGLENVVSFLGFIDNVSAIYRWADVVFLPSKREGMPYVFLECVSWMRPLVAPAVGFFKGTSNSNFVWTFRPSNPTEAADAIQRALSHEPEKPTNDYLFKQLCEVGSWLQAVKEAYELS
jgi:glycosyltransferase involved in cell wall biosynthesis